MMRITNRRSVFFGAALCLPLAAALSLAGCVPAASLEGTSWSGTERLKSGELYDVAKLYALTKSPGQPDAPSASTTAQVHIQFRDSMMFNQSFSVSGAGQIEIRGRYSVVGDGISMTVSELRANGVLLGAKLPATMVPVFNTNAGFKRDGDKLSLASGAGTLVLTRVKE